MSVQVPREELPESVLEPELRPLQSDDRRLSARHPQPVQLAACVPVPTRLSSRRALTWRLGAEVARRRLAAPRLPRAYR